MSEQELSFLSHSMIRGARYIDLFVSLELQY